MKKILSLLITLSLTAEASAQSYEAMWKEVAKYHEKDQPKSALQQAQSIYNKALSEDNESEALYALLTMCLMGYEISPDSATVYTQRLEDMLQNDVDAASKAVTHSLLALCYAHNYDYADDISYKENLNKMRAHFEASVADMAATADAKITRYAALIDKHEGSQYFGYDMLHILLNAYLDDGRLSQKEKAALLQRAAQFYQSRNQQDAALLLTLRAIGLETDTEVKGKIEDNAVFKRLTSLTQMYGQSALAVNIYNDITDLADAYKREGNPWAAHNDSVIYAYASQGIAKFDKKQTPKLRNALTRLTIPAAKIEAVSNGYYPGTRHVFDYKLRNMQQADIYCVRLCDSSLDNRPSSIKEIQKVFDKHKRSLRPVSITQPQGIEAYAWSQGKAELTLPTQPGIYAFVIAHKGKVITTKEFGVSALTALKFATPKGNNRIIVVDAQSGSPIAGAKVTAYKQDAQGKFRQVKSYATDDKGCVNVVSEDRREPIVYVASKDADTASEFFSLSNIRYWDAAESDKAHTTAQLYTDRAIYRPGQKVDFSGVVFSNQGDDYNVVPNFATEVTLYNANDKKVETMSVRTDSLGTLSGSFTLPSQCLPGRFRLSINQGGVNANAYVKVEEYKRPTFTANTLPVKVAYSMGDTVRVEGEAKTYSGVPIVGAKVKYTVQRSAWYFWNDDEFEPQTGETTTDAEGHFTIPMWLDVAPTSINGRYNRYTFTANYTVTAENGETTQGSTALRVATQAAVLSANVPQVICRKAEKALPEFTIKQLNAATEVMKAEGSYEVRKGKDVVANGRFESGVPFTPAALQTLPSGKYTLLYKTTEAQADSSTFVLFCDADTTPADADNPLFFYVDKSEKGDSAHITFGSPCTDATIFFDILSADKLVESKLLTLSNALQRYDFDYRPEYGDGATLYLALWRDGKLYTQKVEVTRPMPEKKLQLKWTSFRSRLVPGQQEQWTLQVMRPDGSPADASLMACLYDASLDAFAKNDWNDFRVFFSRNLSYGSWWTNTQRHSNAIAGYLPYDLLRVNGLNFSQWKESLFRYGNVFHNETLYTTSFGRPLSRPMRSMAALDMAADAGIESAESATVAGSKRMYKNTLGEVPQEAPSTTMRSNFAETAFFKPALRTNAKGEANISFTLPESMTQWNFMALAHTRQMDYGRIDTTVVARKEFMVEPALPRFLRQGDQTALPVKVTNLSDKAIDANLQMVLSDAETKKVIFNKNQKIKLAPGKSKVYTFDYTAIGTDGVLICRTTAQGWGFSDGEEHYLPILTNAVEVTRSLPFSLTEKGTMELRTDTLFNTKNATHRSLTVELSSNPTWYAVAALPALANTDDLISANAWAERLYALTIGNHLAKTTPEIKRLVDDNASEIDALTAYGTEGLTDATPWLAQKNEQRQRAQALRTMFDEDMTAAHLSTAIDKLRTLQTEDGSFSWFPGMRGNALTTVDVATLLARTEKLTQSKQYEAHSLLTSAFRFLQKNIALQVNQMKKEEKQSGVKQLPSEYQLRYLYLRTLMGEKPDADAAFLLDRAEQLQHQLTMYGKAVAAIVLAEAGKKEAAQQTLQSLLEHTVEKTGMGRYFDSNRAEWSWRSYRIPTQCATIETLDYFGKTTEADEMRLWLMQAKRTQMWETSRATTDAVYALLQGAAQSPSITSLKEQTPVYYTLYNKSKVVALNAKCGSATSTTAGYYCDTFTDAQTTAATRLKIDKRTDGLSWGSIRATFTLPASEVVTEGQGLKLTRAFELQQGTEWLPISEQTVLQKGDRIRQVFTLTADRDYDFVKLSASRPACLEPSRPLSGYDWSTSLPAYRAVHDNATDYFIEKLHKGTHRFAEELFIDRSGRFTSGIATLESVYAPEFCGNAAESTIRVK